MMSWNRLLKGKERYGNVRQECTLGHAHRSKLESAVCAMIGLREKAGEIELIKAESHVYLTKARICYIPDFECLDLRTGKPLYVEAKGYSNDRFPIIKKLWAHYGPAPLEIWRGTASRPFLDEIIQGGGAE